MKIYLEPDVGKDISEIRKYYNLHAGKSRTNSIINKIKLALKNLSYNPYGNRKATDTVRELVIHVSKVSYIAPYKIYDGKIYVLRVYDSRRKPQSWNKESNQFNDKYKTAKQELQLSRVKRLNAEKQKGKSK